MEASEFRKRVEELVDNLASGDGSFANTGVDIFIADMSELIEEWESEEHECSM